ncbi:hypothetical protein LTR09_011301 [Extremus antarcticus]|uniref:N-acetyltransferase domain-containing protein n=1 Tax=Extremus antarcticus TaxID=702011 RepID=A0AAJ0G7Z1_9PEZI|nr:hypothetical protein LTR09_011301 [Extremus antarcticus]
MPDYYQEQKQYAELPSIFDRAVRLDSIDQKPTRNLRLACIDDIPRLCAISFSATKRFASIPTLADLADHYDEPLIFQQRLALGNIYIVSEDELAIGFIAGYPMDNTIYIAEVAVHGDHQGKGIGKILMKAVFRWTTERAKYEGKPRARIDRRLLLTFRSLSNELIRSLAMPNKKF